MSISTPDLSLAQDRAAAGAMRVVVLGVGNILLSDEGVGVRAVEELERRYRLPEHVRLIDGGTSAMELLDDLAGADRLIILDAVKSGKPPGALVRLAGGEVPVFFTTKISPHQAGICDVLASLAVMGESPGETVILGVEPASLDLSLDLSPEVAATMPQLLAAVRSELERFGVTPLEMG